MVHGVRFQEGQVRQRLGEPLDLQDLPVPLPSLIEQFAVSDLAPDPREEVGSEEGQRGTDLLDLQGDCVQPLPVEGGSTGVSHG